MVSPVKQGLEKRGSWGLKCLFLADRRLCWIITVHAPNENLSLSLSSLSGVSLAGLFSFRKVSLLLQAPQGFLLSFSLSIFSFSSSWRRKKESGELQWEPRAAWQKEPTQSSGSCPYESYGAALSHLWGGVGQWVAATFTAQWLGRSGRSRCNEHLSCLVGQRSSAQ